jgi:hypothetical protein
MGSRRQNNSTVNNQPTKPENKTEIAQWDRWVLLNVILIAIRLLCPRAIERNVCYTVR